ncbi:hypothetical protein [Chondrinema litorale]|uniref:hypothetical protein n=1 Tax=Chondrinema litorale TaxID=2994555 RepID=UPI002543501D|nr:hypothetical protein [Chondrinema litorale]UZR95761.1 hypothetical protein OQ292_08040 [Chondrinema litorale]
MKKRGSNTSKLRYAIDASIVVTIKLLNIASSVSYLADQKNVNKAKKPNQNTRWLIVFLLLNIIDDIHSNLQNKHTGIFQYRQNISTYAALFSTID